MRVLIAGGGIAGLTAAIALARAGHEVRLFERAPVFREVGAGLQLGPNATRVLRALDLLGPVAAEAFEPDAATIRRGEDGRVLARTPLGPAAEARWGAPYLHIHRADLVAALAAAAAAVGVDLALGAEAVAARSTGDGAELALADGRTLRGDLLGLADGIRSRLVPGAAGSGAAGPRFTGQVAWRALIPAARLPPGLIPPEAAAWTLPGRHLVTYLLRGGTLVNLVAVEERAEWTEEGWQLPGDPARLRAAFADARALAPLLAAVEAPFVWGLFDRPIARLALGRIAVLGDAGHAMLPFLAQGAAMAIEDAAALARHLAGRMPDAALAAWAAERRPRLEAVQRRAAANAAVFHAAGLRRAALEAGLAAARLARPDLLARRLDWLYRHDAVAPG